MKEKFKKYKEWILIVGSIIGIFGGMEGIKMCSDETQEWAQMLISQPAPRTVEGPLQRGTATGIIDTNKITKAVMSK